MSIVYDGSPVATFPLPNTYQGRGIAPSIWQSDPTVRIADIRSNARP